MKNAPNSKANLDKAIDRFAGNPPVLHSVDEAIIWANDLIARIDAAK